MVSQCMLLLVYSLETLIGPYSIFTRLLHGNINLVLYLLLNEPINSVPTSPLLTQLCVKTPSVSLASGILKHFSNYLLIFSHSENYSVNPGLSLSNRSSDR